MNSSETGLSPSSCVGGQSTCSMMTCFVAWRITEVGRRHRSVAPGVSSLSFHPWLVRRNSCVRAVRPMEWRVAQHLSGMPGLALSAATPERVDDTHRRLLRVPSGRFELAMKDFSHNVVLPEPAPALIAVLVPHGALLIYATTAGCSSCKGVVSVDDGGCCVRAWLS